MVPADDPALALNTALAGDGVVITVRRWRHGDAADPSCSSIAAARRRRWSRARWSWSAATPARRSSRLIEAARPADYQVNHRAAAGDRRRGDGRSCQDHGEGKGAIHVATLLADIGARAKFNAILINPVARVSPQSAVLLLAGEGTVANLRGLSLLGGTPHADTTLVVDHAAPNCHEPRAVQGGRRRRGPRRVSGQDHVAPHAQKTDAKMMTRALLLSDDARVRRQAGARDLRRRRPVRPRRHHRHLDDQLIFYLMARGIPEKEARGAADRGLRRRGDRGDRDDERPRRADGCQVGLARAAGMTRCIRRSSNGSL